MNKEELLAVLNARIEEELKIKYLQEDDFNEEMLMTLCEIRDYVEMLELEGK